MEWTMAKASKPVTLREWQAILDSYLKWTRGRGKTDEEVERMEDWFAKETNEAFRAPVRSFDDLVVLAAVACHWNAPDGADDPPYLQCVIDGDPKVNFDARSLAYLVK